MTVYLINIRTDLHDGDVSLKNLVSPYVSFIHRRNFKKINLTANQYVVQVHVIYAVPVSQSVSQFKKEDATLYES
jgi:hypothetical protein